MPTQRYEIVMGILGRDCPPPDYPNSLSLHDLPILEQIIAGGNQIAVERALLAAAQVAPEKAVELLGKAAQNAKPETRIAAARAATFLSRESSSAVVLRLLGDSDTGVVKFALLAAEQHKLFNLKPMIERLAREATSEFVRDQAARVNASLK
jgi:hypothetical protein